MTLDLASAYHRHAGEIQRYIYARIKHREDAEDIISAVWAEVVRKQATYREQGDLRGWLYCIAHSRVVDYIRLQQRRRDRAFDEPWREYDDPAARVVKCMWCHELLQEAPLTSKQRRVIYLRFGRDRPLSEVAELLGMTVMGVKAMQHRALAKLAKTAARLDARAVREERHGASTDEYMPARAGAV